MKRIIRKTQIRLLRRLRDIGPEIAPLGFAVICMGLIGGLGEYYVTKSSPSLTRAISIQILYWTLIALIGFFSFPIIERLKNFWAQNKDAVGELLSEPVRLIQMLTLLFMGLFFLDFFGFLIFEELLGYRYFSVIWDFLFYKEN